MPIHGGVFSFKQWLELHRGKFSFKLLIKYNNPTTLLIKDRLNNEGSTR